MSTYRHLKHISCLSSLPPPREYRLSPHLQPTGVDARPGVFSLTPKKISFLIKLFAISCFLSGADILFSLFRNCTAFILIIKKKTKKTKKTKKRCRKLYSASDGQSLYFLISIIFFFFSSFAAKKLLVRSCYILSRESFASPFGSKLERG